MRKFVLYAVSMLVLVAMLALNSCVKQESLKNKSVEVSFSINNPSLDLNKKVGVPSQPYPECSDAAPAMVAVELSKDGEEGSTLYMLDVLGIEDGNQTEVLKLDVATYVVESFMVYDSEGKEIWAMPTEDSNYDNSWDLNTSEAEEADGQSSPTFETSAFVKNKVSIDVLCFRPYQYEEFGFNWLEFKRIEIKTLCFFGDICTSEYEAWHASGPYADQSYDGYDFPAIFEVVILDAESNEVNRKDNLLNEDESYWGGSGAPLCVEFPDYLDAVDSYTAQIWLVLPDESKVLYEEVMFNAEDDPETITGDDGIYDFVAGELCGGGPVVIDDPGDPNDPEDPVIPEEPEECEDLEEETAFAKFPVEAGYVFSGSAANPEGYSDLDLNGNRWGWAGLISSSTTVPVYAGAGGNDINSGYYVGVAIIEITDGQISVKLDLFDCYEAEEVQIYIDDAAPSTSAPGQYEIYGDKDLAVVEFDDPVNMHEVSTDYVDATGDGVYVILHTKVNSIDD